MGQEKNNKHAFVILLWVIAIAFTLVFYFVNLLLGDLNQDEGWYLYAARCVSRGMHPYIDFASTQGPVMSYVYGALYGIVRLAGLAGGRAITGFFGLAGCLLAARLAAMLTADITGSRGAGRYTALWTLFLLGMNVYHVYFTVIVKTYALTAFLLLLGTVCMVYVAGRRPLAAGIGAGFFYALAAGTRLSALMMAVAAFAVLVFEQWLARKDNPSAVPAALKALTGLVAGTTLTLLVLFVPFVIRSPQGVWFALVEYHAGRESGGWLPAAAYAAGFFARWLRSAFIPLLMLIAVTGWRIVSGKPFVLALPAKSRPAVFSIYGGIVMVTFLHAAAPFPYDDYQVIVMPLMTVAALVLLVQCIGMQLFQPARYVRAVCMLFCLASFAAAAASPVPESWFIAGRDRIWWPLKQEIPLLQLRRIARNIQELCPPGQILLTQDLYLAIEADRDVPRGWELGPFSYFPDWPREKAEICRVVNREMMREILRESGPPAAAFSGYGLSIASPGIRPVDEAELTELWNIVDKNFHEYKRVPSFGQAFTELRIMVKNSEGYSE